MNVLISWSGERSKAIASALREWLPDVMQSLKPFMSALDIHAGKRWSDELGGQLENANFGIVCVTPENREAPWILFEAGALAKSVNTARLVPVLFSLKPADLTGPLAQFQGVEADEQGTLSLIQSLNQALPEHERMTEVRVERLFTTWWPALKERLAKVPAMSSEGSTQTTRTDKDLLEEILSISRRIAGVGEFKPHPSISDMLKTLTTERDRLAARHSFLDRMDDAAEMRPEGAPEDLRRQVNQAYSELRRYEKAVEALENISTFEERKPE